MRLSDLLQSVTQLTASNGDGSWYPLRPKTAENTFFKHRIKAAWKVLTGKADAVEWDYPKPIAKPNASALPGVTLEDLQKS